MPPPAGEAGAAVFARNCSACHQADLSGGTGPALGADSPAASAPLDDLRNTIENGGAGMPAWSGLLTEAEIDAVVAYLAEAQGR
jgi:mono/diheme cytochrome c family protein